MTRAADSPQDYVVKDIGLAEWGRKEIAIAETEMPGLMAIREEYGAEAAAQGRAHRRLAAHDDPDGGADRDAEGARRRRALGLLQHLSRPRTTPPRPIAAAGMPVFAYKGESLEEYWDFTDRIFEWADGGTPNMILDDGGDATLLVHLGVRAEEGDAAFLDKPTNEEEEILFASSRGACKEKPGWYAEAREGDPRRHRGDDHRRAPPLHHGEKGKLLFPAINVNDSVTKSKFDNLYGCRESLVDGIRRGTDVMMAGKVAMVAGFGDVGKGSAASLRQAGCRVLVSEVDPICALQAAMEGYEVTTMEEAATRADIFVTATGNKDVITIDHMRAMKDRAIVCNIGHFDNEIQVAGLRNLKWQTSSRRSTRSVPRRPPHHPPVGGAPCESRQRDGPPVLRDVGLLHQPDPGADRAVDEPGRATGARSIPCRSASTRRSRCCTSTRSASG